MQQLSRRLKASLAGACVAATLAATAGIVVATGAAAASQVVATANVNLRSGPGTSYAIIGYLPSGATATATGVVSGSWIQVTYAGKTGYVFGSYVTTAAATPPPTTTVAAGSATTTGDVNVRSGPGTSYAIVGVAARGTTLPTTGTVSGGWTQVVWQGVNRWISTSYLTTAPVVQQVVAPLPPATGQIRTTASAYLRAEGVYGATILTTVPANSLLSTTGAKTASYTQVIYNGRLGWVATSLTASVEVTPVAPVSLDARQAKMVAWLEAQVGKAYVWGGEGPDGYDCSGLVKMAYAQVGIALPHYSVSQSQLGTAVTRADLRPGDIIAWYSPVQHVSVYVGGGMMIHAANTRTGVVKQSVDSYAQWAYLNTIRRVLT